MLVEDSGDAESSVTPQEAITQISALKWWPRLAPAARVCWEAGVLPCGLPTPGRAPAPPHSLLCAVHNSPARWRGVESSLFKPIAHPVGTQRGCGQDTWALAQATAHTPLALS